MRFGDFLRVAVLLFGGAGTALAVVSIAGASGEEDSTLPIAVAVGWWVVAAVAGLWLGRRDAPVPQIGRLLASARATNSLPEVEPGAVVLNRLWPLAVVTIASGSVAFLMPQIPAIAAGYAIAVALTWRRQPNAVAAIEQRDGVWFHVDRTSPLAAPKLLRTPGLRKLEPADSPRAAGPL